MTIKRDYNGYNDNTLLPNFFFLMKVSKRKKKKLSEPIASVKKPNWMIHELLFA